MAMRTQAVTKTSPSYQQTCVACSGTERQQAVVTIATCPGQTFQSALVHHLPLCAGCAGDIAKGLVVGVAGVSYFRD